MGPTSMHEHVLADASALARPGIETAPRQQHVDAAVLGYLRWNQLGLADNLRLDDPTLAVEELERAGSRGQRAVVDATSLGLGPDHANLPGIARRSGVVIVVAYGSYLEPTLPGWFAALDEAAREALFLAALTDAVPGVGYRAAMLGIMGTSARLHGSELASLRAAAGAAAATGASVSIRLDPDGRNGLEVIGVCVTAGLDPRRILLTNTDEYLDASYHRDLAQSGAVLEMCFGNDAFHYPRVRNPSDLQRLDFLLDALRDEPSTRWVLGASVWTKAQLTHFGGGGYEHLQARVVPALRAAGLGAERLDDMLVRTPAMLLDRP
jgi:phosphotriesterase-related protein